MVRQRQGCVPDLAVRLPTIQGQTTRHLSKQKFISSGSSRYPKGCDDKAVDRRARALPEEYRARFSAIDRHCHGDIRGQIGPLKERFGSMGELQFLVVGMFGEGSQHLHSLVRSLAESRTIKLARTLGRPYIDTEICMVLSQYRRVLSTTFVQVQAVCLLTRIGHLGEGWRQASKRRQITLWDYDKGS